MEIDRDPAEAVERVMHEDWDATRWIVTTAVLLSGSILLALLQLAPE